jgi:F0F1-type ATP synthase membrane subunit a
VPSIVAAASVTECVAHDVLLSAPVLAPEEHALSQKAIDLARPFGLPITNSMEVTWTAGIALIVFAQLATRNIQQVPSGAQNFLEWMVEGLYNFLKGILGAHLVERTFWFFATIFILILTAKWIGLIPGVRSIGWGHYANGHFVIEEPLLRGANADVNMTFAMALVKARSMGELYTGIAALGAAVAVGLIGASAAAAVGRNPGSSTPVMVQSILDRVRRGHRLLHDLLVK